jgi:hypothetical protein
MAPRKSATSPKASKTPAKAPAKAPAKVAPPVDAEGFLCLTGDRLWKWRALDAELRAGQTELERLSGAIQAEISKHADLANMIQQKAALGGTVSVAKSELLAVQAQIEAEMGVSLKECAFDDKTGRLYHLTTDGSRGEAVRAAKRPRKSRR